MTTKVNFVIVYCLYVLGLIADIFIDVMFIMTVFHSSLYENNS